IASRSSSSRRSMASVRLRSWVRKRWAWIMITPSLVMRWPASRFSRRLASSGSVILRVSKRSCAAVESLLTFCPPGPEARTKPMSMSFSSIERSRETRSMAFTGELNPRLLEMWPDGALQGGRKIDGISLSSTSSPKHAKCVPPGAGMARNSKKVLARAQTGRLAMRFMDSIERLVPAVLGRSARNYLDVRAWRRLQPPLQFDNSNLRRVSHVDLASAMNDPAIGAVFTEDHAAIAEVFGAGEIAGGVNPGDRRALYQLVGHFKPRRVLEIGTHVGASA